MRGTFSSGGIFGPIWTLRSTAVSERALLVLSALAALSIFLFSDAIALSDSNTYLIYAEALVRLQVNPGVYFRTPGYPLFLVVALYPLLHSLALPLLLQAGLAALTPWLAFKTLQPTGRAYAVLAGYLALLSGLPFLYQTIVYPDQLQLTLLMAAICLAVRLATLGDRRLMAPLFGVVLALSFLRPTLLLLVGVVVLMLIATIVGRKIHGQERRVWVIGAAKFTFLILCMHVFAAGAEAAGYWRIQMEKPSFQGHQLFYNVYMNSAGTWEDLDPNSAGASLKAGLATFFADPNSPPLRQYQPGLADVEYYRDIVRLGATNPGAAALQVLDQPGVHSYWFISTISDQRPDLVSDRLLGQVAFEHYWANPIVAFDVLKTGLAGFFWGTDCNIAPELSPFACKFYPAYGSEFGPQKPAWPQFAPWDGGATYFRPLLGEDHALALAAPFEKLAIDVWPGVYRWGLPAATLATLLGALGIAIIRLRKRWDASTFIAVATWMIIVGGLLSYQFPMLLLVDSQFRYQSAGGLPLLLAGVASLRLLALALGVDEKHARRGISSRGDPS